MKKPTFPKLEQLLEGVLNEKSGDDSHGGRQGGGPTDRQSTLLKRLPLPNLSSFLRVFCTRNPATIPMVVGKEAAQTPSRFNVFSSMPEATIRGGAQAKQDVSPGEKVVVVLVFFS